MFILFYSPDQESGVAAAAPAQWAPVPIELVWRHGGKSVFVESSIDSWSKRDQLFPVSTGIDGSVFGRVFFALPGAVQYKFIVDGQWRAAPEQPQVIAQRLSVYSFTFQAAEKKPSANLTR